MSLKQDFLDWKQHPITKAVFAELKQREDDLKDALAVSAGLDPKEDSYRRGYIAAVRDFYLTTLEDKENTND